MVSARPMCMRCRRPTSVCYCAAVPTLETQTRVVILQHPRERDMPIGTARMATLALPNAELRVGMRWPEPFGTPERPAVLLWPAAGAKDILTEPPSGPITLVVVDGTWSQARTLVRDNPVLAALPRYAFATPEPSHYRIRREPRAEYVSTIEALMHVLGVLEGDPARFRALLDPLNAMVDAQLACQQGAPRRVSYRKPAPPRPPRLPDALARWDDLVCVVGEANAWPYTRGETRKDELVHWVAQRVATGETFEMLAAPAGELAPSTTFHTRLPAEDIMGAGPASAIVDGFARFVRPTDIVCAWGHYGTNLFVAAGGTLPQRLDLRAAAQRFTNRKLGGFEEYAAEFGAIEPVLRGRAGERLARIVQILRAWRQLVARDDL